jgi:hypothetical protein
MEEGSNEVFVIINSFNTRVRQLRRRTQIRAPNLRTQIRCPYGFGEGWTSRFSIFFEKFRWWMLHSGFPQYIKGVFWICRLGDEEFLASSLVRFYELVHNSASASIV